MSDGPEFNGAFVEAQLTAEIAAKDAVIEELVTALKMVEWAEIQIGEDAFEYQCPVCEEFEIHALDCQIAEALAHAKEQS